MHIRSGSDEQAQALGKPCVIVALPPGVFWRDGLNAVEPQTPPPRDERIVVETERSAWVRQRDNTAGIVKKPQCVAHREQMHVMRHRSNALVLKVAVNDTVQIRRCRPEILPQAMRVGRFCSEKPDEFAVPQMFGMRMPEPSFRYHKTRRAQMGDNCSHPCAVFCPHARKIPLQCNGLAKAIPKKMHVTTGPARGEFNPGDHTDTKAAPYRSRLNVACRCVVIGDRKVSESVSFGKTNRCGWRTLAV